MSDQGDAGQWRPATSESDHYSTPDDDTTGPLPAIGRDDDAPGFPSVSPSSPGPSWSSADSAEEDDAPTGGFPAVPMPEEFAAPEPPARVERSPFEPADHTKDAFEAPIPSPRPLEPEPEDPGPTGATPRFGTEVPDPQPPADPPFGAFGTDALTDKPYDDKLYDDKPYKPSSYDDKPYEPASYDDKPYEPSSYDDKPYEPAAYDDKPYEQPASYGTKPFETFEAKPHEEPEGSWGPGTFASPAPEDSGLPAAQGVTAEDQDAENDFFASDDHPPLWDKVVAPSGPPPKPGKPSSGNLRLPEWMRDENGGLTAPGAPSGPADIPEYEDEGHSRRPLYIGLGILVAGLVAAGSAYALKGNGDNQASNASAPTQSTPAASAPPTRPAQNPPVRKQLPRFKGVHTKAAGRVSDPRSGLSYARFDKPWAPAPAKSPMNELGFSASQFAVTEKAGGQPKHWARLMSAQLPGSARSSYNGPGTEHGAATDLAKIYEARMFTFRHRKRVLASQPLNVGGHKGWLVSDYVTYQRQGLKATGDVVTVAVVDTGKSSPGVLFMSVPNTSRKLWPDINFVVRSLRVS